MPAVFVDNHTVSKQPHSENSTRARKSSSPHPLYYAPRGAQKANDDNGLIVRRLHRDAFAFVQPKASNAKHQTLGPKTSNLEHPKALSSWIIKFTNPFQTHTLSTHFVYIINLITSVIHKPSTLLLLFACLRTA